MVFEACPKREDHQAAPLSLENVGKIARVACWELAKQRNVF